MYTHKYVQSDITCNSLYTKLQKSDQVTPRPMAVLMKHHLMCATVCSCVFKMQGGFQAAEPDLPHNQT